jgi:hypothetical protein
MDLSTIFNLFGYQEKKPVFTKNTKLFYSEIGLTIKVITPGDTLTSKIPKQVKLNDIHLPKLYYTSPVLSIFGLGYRHVSWDYSKEAPRTLGKILPACGLTAIGAAAASYLIKRSFYGRYLNDPYNQSGAYKTANIAQKAMVISGLAWLCVVPLDLTFTIRQMKRTKSWIRTNSL